MEPTPLFIKKDLVIVGAGIPGIVHAVLAARLGVRVALVQNRGYVGGNASAEIGVDVTGATGTQEFNFFARETGVIEELVLENLARNPEGNRYVWDSVLMDMLLAEKNIELFLNTNVFRVETENGHITCAIGTQLTSGKLFSFKAPLFADDTGDGQLAYLAGAGFHYGREAASEYGERIAPKEADHYVIPSTLAFTAHNAGHSVRYIPPHFALNLKDTDVLKYRIIPKNDFARSQWFYELDGDLDQLSDAETILEHHRALVYGIWDYIKNSGEYDADNYVLDYVSPIMGKRESRRIIGDYVLTEGDLTQQRTFPDAIGYGGWSIDLHAIRGFYAKEPVNRHVFLKGVYSIPYRCGYAKDVDNLFIEGRCMSTSHVGFGSTRVMGTLSTVAQANAVASALCKKYACLPRDITKTHMDELQTLLLKQDQYIIGKPYRDEANLAAEATVTASSTAPLSTLAPCEARLPLSYDTAIALPVRHRMDTMTVFAAAKKETHLHAKAFISDRAGNFNPVVCVGEADVVIPASEALSPCALPLHVVLKEAAYVTVILSANEDITLGTTSFAPAGVLCLYCKPVNEDTLIDVDTLDKKSIFWRHRSDCILFSADTDEGALRAANVQNGFTRPYIGANAWQSLGISGEWLRFTWPEEHCLREMTVIFDSSLDRPLRTTSPNKQPVLKALVRDYDVFANINGQDTLVLSVRDNHQRLNTLDLGGVVTRDVRLRFHTTYGAPQITVFDVRFYE